MDTAFEFLLPSNTELSDFNFIQPTYELGGVKYPQSSEECIYSSIFKLIKIPVAEHIMALIQKKNINDTWVCISVSGEGLDIFQRELEEGNPQYARDELNQLIKSILSTTKYWAVVFEYKFAPLGDERFGQMEEVLTEIERTILRDSNGFIFFPLVLRNS